MRSDIIGRNQYLYLHITFSGNVLYNNASKVVHWNTALGSKQLLNDRICYE